MHCRIVNWLVFGVFVFFSCQKEKRQIIPSSVEPFVTTFFYEGEKRNLDVSLEDIDLEVEFTQFSNHFVGTCSSRKNHIKIDTEFWENADNEHKEWLIFHELGHCLLERPHRNDFFGNSECQSLMQGGEEDDFFCSMNLYSSYWRTYYLDELFNRNVGLPAWYTEKQDYPYDENTRTYITNSLVFDSSIEDSISGLSDKWAIEISFGDWLNKTNSVGFSLDNILVYYCHICTEDKLKIQYNNKLVFWSNDFDLSDCKLSIVIKDDLCIFFANEIFLHSFEFQQKDENRVRTISFDEKINMHYEVYTFL